MANYKETQVTGMSYVRAKEIVIRNDLNGYKGAWFTEERVTQLPDGAVTNHFGNINQPLTDENCNTEFQLLNPESGEPTGQTMKFADVYSMLFSLYYHVAAVRDAAATPSIPVVTEIAL